MRDAPGDKQVDSGDEARITRRQEEGRSRDLFGLADRAPRDERDECVDHLPREAVEDEGAHRARGEHVDAVVAPFKSTVRVLANERRAALLALSTPRAGKPFTLAMDPIRARFGQCSGDPPIFFVAQFVSHGISFFDRSRRVEVRGNFGLQIG